MTGDLTGKDSGKLNRTFNNTLFAKRGILLLKHTLTFLPVGIDINTSLTHLLDKTVTKDIRVTLVKNTDIMHEIRGVVS